MTDRDALILLLQDQVQTRPWPLRGRRLIRRYRDQSRWLRIQCGSMVPNTDELWASR